MIIELGKFRLVLFAALLWAVSNAAKAQGVEDYVYETNAGNASITITSYLGAGGDISLPAVVNKLPVTEIGPEAFNNCTTLTNLTIPANVVTIDNYAFEGCSALTNVNFPATLKSISEGGFYYCGLTAVTIPPEITSVARVAFAGCAITGNVTIPASVTNLGETPFGLCTNLTGLMVDPANLFYSSMNGVLFNKNQTGLIEFPGGLSGSYAVPAGVTGLSNFSFAYSASGLTNVTLPDSVTNIGGQAFQQCLGLTRFIVPGGVTNIQQGAFASCYYLTNITLPASLTNLGSYAFFQCVNLASVYFAGNAPTADSTLFQSSGNPTIYYLPGASGWSSSFAGEPAVLWNPQIRFADATIGVSVGQLTFSITGPAGLPLVLQACSDLENPVWLPLQSLTLTNGLFKYSVPVTHSSPNQFYRVRSQ